MVVENLFNVGLREHGASETVWTFGFIGVVLVLCGLVYLISVLSKRKCAVMRRFLCFVTGGHRYSDVNLTSKVVSNDPDMVELNNYCVKCGKTTVQHLNVGKIIEEEKNEKNERW